MKLVVVLEDVAVGFRMVESAAGMRVLKLVGIGIQVGLRWVYVFWDG